MLKRTFVLKIFLYVLGYLFPKSGFLSGIQKKVQLMIHKINGQQFVYFTNHDDVATLNKIMLYIKENEATRKLKIVAVLDKGVQVVKNLKNDISVLNRAYPSIDIDFVEVEGVFGPEKIKELSKEWNIPTNFMFIGSPGDKFPYRLEELGEVRLII